MYFSNVKDSAFNEFCSMYTGFVYLQIHLHSDGSYLIEPV